MIRKKQVTIQSISADEMQEILKTTFIDVLDNVTSLSKPQKAQYISRNEVAKILGVTSRCIYNWTKKGILVSYTIGGKVRYRSEEIENALKPSIPKGVK